MCFMFIYFPGRKIVKMPNNLSDIIFEGKHNIHGFPVLSRKVEQPIQHLNDVQRALVHAVGLCGREPHGLAAIVRGRGPKVCVVSWIAHALVPNVVPRVVLALTINRHKMTKIVVRADLGLSGAYLVRVVATPFLGALALFFTVPHTVGSFAGQPFLARVRIGRWLLVYGIDLPSWREG